MHKILLLILYFSLINSSTGKRKRRETATNNTTVKWDYQPNNCTQEPIDVRLHDLTAFYSAKNDELEEIKSNHTGLIEIVMPHMPGSLFLCYPDIQQNHQQLIVFAQITCRQLGYMTFIAINEKELPRAANGKRYYGLKSSSYHCTGQEQSISHCRWGNISLDTCKMATEISCGACHNTVNDVSGLINSPGFPQAYLFDVTCEWKVVATKGHSVLLSFHHLHDLFPSVSTHCSLHRPYIEITYGNSGRMNLRRYCYFKGMQNLTIPHREVKIRIFTGLFGQPELLMQENEKGIAISFIAIEDETILLPWKLILLSIFVSIFITTTVICYYCNKYKLLEWQVPRNYLLPTVTAPNAQDLDMAYEFQRCHIQGKEKRETQGLRLRSNGSGGKVSRIFFPSTPGTAYEIPKANDQYSTEIETPKMIIPEIILNDATDGEHQNPILRVKAKLMDRYSRSNSSTNDPSKLSSSTPIFFHTAPSFQIFHSQSSDDGDDRENKGLPPPYETAL